MNSTLTQTIDRLYEVFKPYPLKPTIEGCPCCVAQADKERIHTKPLQELTAEDLIKYSGKAMTTWGDEEDFKHFLPRILELLFELSKQYDIDIILGKLTYAKWEQWDKKEIEAIKEFLVSWWSRIIAKDLTFGATEYLMTIVQYVGDMELLLSIWTESQSEQSLRNLVDFICNDSQSLLLQKKKGAFTNVLEQWLTSEQMEKKLEQSFFHFEATDKDFALLISNSYEIVKLAQKVNQLTK